MGQKPTVGSRNSEFGGRRRQLPVWFRDPLSDTATKQRLAKTEYLVFTVVICRVC
jgi:hypothetical protein